MQEVTDFVNKSEIIKQIPLFSDLNWIESWVILPKLAFFEYKKNEIIYTAGDPGDAFYLLLSGRLQVSKKLSGGQEKTLDYLTRNKYFGIISLLSGESHSGTVKVINDSFILRIKKEDFNNILQKIPKLAVHMSKSLSRRLRRRRLHPEDIFETKIISALSVAARVGVSRYLANLSISLKKETTKQVILIEINSAPNSIFKNLGLSSEVYSLNLNHTNLNKAQLKENITTHTCGIDLLSVSYNLKMENGQNSIAYLLGMLMEDYSYIVIDLPKSPEAIVNEVLGQSDLIHIVTDDQEDNLKATRILIEKLRNSVEEIEDNIFIVVNEVESKRVRLSSKQIRDILNDRVYVSLQHFTDPLIKRSGFIQVLECPDTNYALAVRNVAREIGEVLIGLALSGGASFGLAHIGVLKVLEEENINIDLIAGTSMGAFVGGLWASGVSVAGLEKIALGFRNKLRVLRLFDFVFPRRGLILGGYILKLLRKHLKVKTFQEVKIPFLTVACDLESRQEVILDEGDLARAIRASISIPGVFIPLVDEGRFLMDGGILQPLPIQLLIRKGVSKIIAVDVLPSQLDIKKAYQRYRKREDEQLEIIKKSNIFKKLFYWLGKKIHRMFFPNIFDAIVIAMQASEAILAEASRKQADVYLHPDLSEISWFEFYRAEELIKSGEKEARRLLPQIKQILANKN